MGKGSVRRPTLVRDEEFQDNWNTIFRRNDKNAEKSRYKRGQRDKDRK